MTLPEFKEQIGRLKKIFGDKYYPNDRMQLMYECYKSTKYSYFEAAINYLVLNSRRAPLLEDITKALNRNVARRYSSGSLKNDTDIKIRDFSDVLNIPGETSNPEFVQTCKAHLKNYWNGKIDLKQFLQGCDELDEMADRINPNAAKENPENWPPRYPI